MGGYRRMVGLPRYVDHFDTFPLMISGPIADQSALSFRTLTYSMVNGLVGRNNDKIETQIEKYRKLIEQM